MLFRSPSQRVRRVRLAPQYLLLPLRNVSYHLSLLTQTRGEKAHLLSPTSIPKDVPPRHPDPAGRFGVVPVLALDLFEVLQIPVKSSSWVLEEPLVRLRGRARHGGTSCRRRGP